MRWRRNRNRPPDLSKLPVPQHRAGFWEDLDDELAGVDARPASRKDDRGEVVELAAQGSPVRRVSPWLAASAAAAIVLVLGGATAILTRPAADSDVVATPEAAITSNAAAESLTGTEPPSTPTEEAGRAPWELPRLRSADAPDVLEGAWNEAENQQWCSGLTPATLAALGNDAAARRADFGGGWAVAWDRPDGPGQEADGSDCADCGRSSFGVAGTGTTHRPDTGQTRTADVLWSDGSFAHIGPEGGDDSRTKLLANIVVDGQGCLYQVWSNNGDEHLRRLVDSLRLVEGMMAEPVVLRTASDEPSVVTRGEPPWSAAALDVAADPLLLAKWDEMGVSGPQLMLADVGEGADFAEMRTWGGGVAWNNPAGPGHDGQNQPCADCGRGAIGVGWQVATEDPPAGILLPYRIEWADGSYAEYGGRLADPALPRDRVLFFDPDTGEATMDALQAIVHVEGSSYDVIVWSHLGKEHLLYLIDQLRWLDPAG